MAKNEIHRIDGNEKLLDVRKIWAIIWKNWLVLKSDRMRLFPMLIFPVIMITVFGFASVGTIHNLPTALVDYDHSAASGMLQTSLRQVNTISISYEIGSEDEAKRLMDEGRIKAIIIIPYGFGTAIETGTTQTKVTVIADESDSTATQMIRAVVQQAIGQYSQQQAIARLQSMLAKQSTASQAMKQGAGFLQTMSEQFADDSSLKADEQSISYISTILQRDIQQTNAAQLALQNSVGYSENADNYYLGNGKPASYDAILLQIQLLEARKASDAKALASLAKLRVSNARNTAGNAASSASAATTASALTTSADSLPNPQVQVILTPVLYENQPAYGLGRKGIDFLLPSIIAMVIFQGAAMGMGRALAGEKKDGSLTRVFLTPTSNTTILTGTMLFYMIFETFRSSFLVFAAMLLFGVTLQGSLLLTLFVIMIFTAGCTAIGLLLSAITTSQEQYMAVAMLVSLPAMFLSGVFLPIQTMPEILQVVANILPIPYAATALRGIMIKGFDLIPVLPQVLILLGFAVAFITLALVVFKREIV